MFKEALDRGIKVITHEADNQVNTLYDIEAFDNMAFGAQLNERLASCMGGEGKWTVFVGSLGSKTHNQWADGGIENAAANQPGMELVDAKQETFDDADGAKHRLYPHRPKVSCLASAFHAWLIGSRIFNATIQAIGCAF